MRNGLKSMAINLHAALLIAFLQVSCNLSVGDKSPQQVSKSIVEAKKNNVFVREFTITSVEVLDKTIVFPFSEVWEEKHWNLVLDNTGNESPKIDDSSAHLIIVRFNNKDSFLTVGNFTAGKWIMWDKSKQSIGTTCDMLNMSVQKDFNNTLLSLTIYKQQATNDINNNLIPLVKFNLGTNK